MKLIHTEITEQNFYLPARKLQIDLLFNRILEANTETYKPTVSMHILSRKLTINIMESEGKSDELSQVAEEHLHSETNSIPRYAGYSIRKRVHLLS